MRLQHDDRENILSELDRTGKRLIDQRPTAVNLRWAVERVLRVAHAATDVAKSVSTEAQAILDEDIYWNRCIGMHGQTLINTGDRILTHCNAGGLATSGLGTALGIVKTAHAQGKAFSVYVDETRPLLQGARLTTWELKKCGIPHELICDSMAASLMRQSKVTAVLVGADRIAANGDTANKIGTYGLAVNCHYHGIPFYVAAPSSTIDATLATGEDIPIEIRDAAEVTEFHSVQTAPDGTAVYNPAFDVTPGHLVTAVITETGITYGPEYCFGRPL